MITVIFVIFLPFNHGILYFGLNVLLKWIWWPFWIEMSVFVVV